MQMSSREAIELDDRGFVLGVQWHPEENDADIRVFAAVVAHAARRRAYRAAGLDPTDNEQSRRAAR
jgi:putative glutamine amidotransferase